MNALMRGLVAEAAASVLFLPGWDRKTAETCYACSGDSGE